MTTDLKKLSDHLQEHENCLDARKNVSATTNIIYLFISDKDRNELATLTLDRDLARTAIESQVKRHVEAIAATGVKL